MASSSSKHDKGKEKQMDFSSLGPTEGPTMAGPRSKRKEGKESQMTLSSFGATMALLSFKRYKGNEPQTGVFSLDSYPEEILSIIVTKVDLQDVVMLRMVNKTFSRLASEQSTLKHLLGPKIMKVGLKSGAQSDGSDSQEFDARAVFKHISNLLAMVRVVDEERSLLLFSRTSFLLNVLEEGEKFYDTESTKVCFMDPNSGKACLAVAAYHPGLTITSGLDSPSFNDLAAEDGNVQPPHWVIMLPDSRFDKSAFFWMGYKPEINGLFEVKLPPGRYSFSWVWRFKPGRWDPENAMDAERIGKDKLISIASSFTDGKVCYDWRLVTYNGFTWDLIWNRDPPESEGYSRRTLELVNSAIRSAQKRKNLKVKALKGREFLEHEIGRFRVKQENATDYGSYVNSVLEYEMYDQVGTVGAGDGLHFDGFIIRSL